MAIQRRWTGRGPWWLAATALLGAGAALALPGPTGSATGVAAVLVVGGLALLAGHTWGLLVVVVADVLLVGQVWPTVALAHHSAGPGAFAHAAAATALVSALPGFALIGVTLPSVVDVVLGEPSSRARAAGVAAGSVLLLVSLILPAL